MRRTVLCLYALLFITCAARGQEATPLGSLDLDFSRLKTWGTKTYTYEASRPGGERKTIMGQLILKTELTHEAVLLSDHVEIQFRGEKLVLDLAHRCKKDNFLSPVRIDSEGEGDDEFGTFVVAIEGDEATVRSDGRERTMQLPETVVTFSAFFRLVTLLPRQEGTRISFPHWLESEELNLKKDFVAECMGPDAIQSGPEGVTCTKFRLTGGGNHPAYYWVDGDGVLRQVLIDERKLIRLRASGVEPPGPDRR